MKPLFVTLSSLLLCAACSQQYNIDGNSTVRCLDGHKLYLRVTTDDDAHASLVSSVCVDSCEIIHGRFSFQGEVDSARMALLFTERNCVMPLVLENGNLSIEVDNLRQRVTGGPLNDKLYAFFKKRNRLDNELWELQQKSIRMMREGRSPEEIDRKVGRKAEKLMSRTEELETSFVRDNYDNVLGPGFFMLLCSQYPTPIMTRQIQTIVDGAPSHFMHHPFVRRYVREARYRTVTKRKHEDD